jgi:large subunit ribosomal protein L3
MVRHSKPRAGSLQFWPRKRSKRIYPRVSHWSEGPEMNFMGFAGYKAGMTTVTLIDSKKNSLTKGEEICVPVSVLDCPPLSVLGFRFYKKNPDGLKILSEVYDEKLLEDKDTKRKIKGKKSKRKFEEVEKKIDSVEKVRAIVRTNPRKSGLGKKKPEVFEIEISGPDNKEKLKFCKEKLGKEIKVSDVFKDGEHIDVTAITKGKGFQGQVKRFGVKIQIRKDKGKRRHIGSLGPEGVRRILYTVPLPGQLGFFKRTEFNKRIVKIGEEGKEITPDSGFNGYGVISGNYVLLEGSIPGPRKRMVVLRSASRPPETRVVTSEIKNINK